MNTLLEIVFDYAKKQPDALCVADVKKAVSYEQFIHYVYGFRQYLQQAGAKEGDCIVVRSSHTVEYLAAQMGMQMMGVIFVPMEKIAPVERLEEIYDDTSALFYMADRQAESDKKFVPLSIVADNVYEGALPSELTFPKPEQTAEILYSTGTTGKSKGIVISHKANVKLAENVKNIVEMKEHNVELIPGPLNHSNALRRIYANYLNGSTVVLLDGIIFINNMFKLMDQYKVTAIALVPAMLTIIYKLSKDKLADYKDQIDYIQLGASKMPQADKDKLCELLPNSRLYDIYGSTEAGCACAIDFNHYKNLGASIGKPAVNSVCGFFDQKGNRLSSVTKDNPGRIGFAGDTLMDGYYHEEELTKQTIIDGFVVSNDLAYLGEDGMVYFVGRKDDVIIVGGSKVDPTEVEEAANKIDAVEDCACIGIEDEIAGHVPKLFIQPKNKKTYDEKAIYDALVKTLEGYKVPKAIEMIDKIPRTFNGKIIRRELK